MCFKASEIFLTSKLRLVGIYAAIFLSLSWVVDIHAFHQFVPRVEQNDCPVRIHSTRIENIAQLPPNETTETSTANLGSESESKTASGGGDDNGGQNIRPWPNNTGILSSDYYQPNEFLKSKCQFIFLGAADEHVQIIFHKFSLYTANHAKKDSVNGTTNQLRCEEEDHVTAHVLVGSRMSKIHDFCGDEVPPRLMSAKNLLTLSYVIKSGLYEPYHTDDDVGFVLEYRFLRNYGQQPPEAVKIANESCSFVFNGSIKTSGDLWSPNYPGFYPRNLDCQYVFHGRDDQIVLISFEYFDVEGFGQCEETTQSDFVLFSNYKTMDRTNRRYCGATRPPKIALSSESNYFRMQFRTNDIFDGTGFYAHYQFYRQQLSQSSRIRMTTSVAPKIRQICLIPFSFVFLLQLIFKK